MAHNGVSVQQDSVNVKLSKDQIEELAEIFQTVFVLFLNRFRLEFSSYYGNDFWQIAYDRE